MRIVTRPDFDGVVCAALLYEAENIIHPTLWIEPSEIQHQIVDIQPYDIIANLPYNKNCALWFDHHFSNKHDFPFKGKFDLTPSAARIIFTYYQNRFKRDYSELVHETDRIDAARLTEEEVQTPEINDYVILSMTLFHSSATDEFYWNKLVRLLRTEPIKRIVSDPEIMDRIKSAVQKNQAYSKILAENTKLVGNIAVTDFRKLGTPPTGNRFLVYSLYPRSYAHVKIQFDRKDTNQVSISIGHNIFNSECRINVGRLLTNYNGGGHRGAASSRVPARDAEKNLAEIVQIMNENQSNETI